MSKVNTHFKKNVWWYLLGSGVGSWLVVVIPGLSWWHGLLFGLIVVVAVGCACRVRSVRVLLVFSIVISIPVLVLPLLSYFGLILVQSRCYLLL